jgi:hypothetical protein
MRLKSIRVVGCVALSLAFFSAGSAAPGILLRGDLDNDRMITAVDCVLLINYFYHQGPVPDPLWITDVNCDARYNLADVARLINHVYRSGPPPCVAGFALEFDGHNDLVEIPFVAAYNTESFTLEAWIYIKEPQVDYISSIIDRWTFDISAQVWALWIVSGDPYALRGGYDGSADDGELTAGSITANQWYHVAYTREASGLRRLYIDGVLAGEMQAAAGGNFAETPLRIGHSNGGPLRAFYGWIDEVRVWNIARTGAEITAAKNTTLTGAEPGLVGYWDFDEGLGDVVDDLSPTGHHGQLGHQAGPDDSDPKWVVSSAPVSAP